MDTIESVILKKVEVQANGIIRNEKGCLIARLVDDVEYEGEHIKGLKNPPTAHDFFKKILETEINKLSLEQKSNTQEFILASYLHDCLLNFEKHILWRDKLKSDKI